MSKNSGAKDEHCQSMMSKMWDLRSQDQFCDIAIKVDQKVFQCHRIFLCAASEYFRAMFGGGFSESTATEVTLHEVDADVFETILQLIYTGNAHINASNACGLIHAADFYGLAMLENYLIEFAKEKYQTLSNEDILKIFTSAHTSRMKSLCRFFIEYIYGDFGCFSDSPEFINLTWDSLMELAGEASRANKPALSDTFVEGTLKWIRGQVAASADERRGSYIKQFINILHQTASFTNCVHLLDQYVNAEQAPKRNAVAVLDERPQKLLRAFVTRPPGFWFRSKGSSIFTLHEMNAGLAWAYSGEFNLPARQAKNILMDDTFYSLVPSGNIEGGSTFVRHRRAFAGAPHISMYQRQSLRPPPCITSNFEICGVDNSIFAHNKIGAVKRNYTGDPNFTVEKPSRGVLLYKRDADVWSSLPPPQKYDNSCMTCDERMVYLIGGKNSGSRVQGYDLRAPAWITLASTAGIYEDAACCNRDGKIWVVGGRMNPTRVEIFDPIAGTWECGKHLIEIRSGPSQLVHWDSVQHGRTVVSCRRSSYADQKIVFADDSQLSGWNVIPDLRPALNDSRIAHSGQYVPIMDMVAF